MAAVLGLVLATLGLGSSPGHGVEAAEQAPAPEPAVAPEPVRYGVVLDGAIEPSEGLPDELALRLGDRSIDSARTLATEPDGPYVWVAVDEVRAGAVEIRLIVSDGRLYTRTTEAPAEQGSRVVAGAVANMLDAIENNRLAPQQTGVAVPVPVAQAEAGGETTAPDGASTGTGEGSGGDVPPAAAGAVAVPRAWVGVVAGGGATFGLGPPTESAGVTGLGGGLGVQAVLERGVVVGLSGRGSGWRSEGVSLTRVRVAAVAGYAWRSGRSGRAGERAGRAEERAGRAEERAGRAEERAGRAEERPGRSDERPGREDERPGRADGPGRFELLVAAGPTVEFIRVGAELLSADDRSRSRIAPLLGGCVLVRPMVTVAEPRGARVGVGVEVEAAASVEARAPAGAVQLERETAGGSRPIARAGGFELETGVVVEVRFGLRQRGG